MRDSFAALQSVSLYFLPFVKYRIRWRIDYYSFTEAIGLNSISKFFTITRTGAEHVYDCPRDSVRCNIVQDILAYYMIAFFSKRSPIDSNFDFYRHHVTRRIQFGL